MPIVARKDSMKRTVNRSVLLLFVCLLTIGPVLSQTPKSKAQRARAKRETAEAPLKRQAHGPVATPPAPNLAKEPTLYVVGYAHLDTEWRWEYPQVIQEYLTKTMRNNFALFEKYPHYIFNFTGANRYRLMKDY